MYPTINIAAQIVTGEDDDGSCAGGESIDNHHIHYETPALDEGGGGVGGVMEDVTSDTLYVSGGGGPEMSAQRCDDSQLTLSFRGQVYVFDSVTPDKVAYYFSLFLCSFLQVFLMWCLRRISRARHCVLLVLTNNFILLDLIHHTSETVR